MSTVLLNDNFTDWDNIDEQLIVAEIEATGLPYYGFHQDMPPPTREPRTSQRVRVIMPFTCGTQYIQDGTIDFDPDIAYEKSEWNARLKLWSVGKRVLQLADFEMAIFDHRFVHSIPSVQQLTNAGLVGKKRHVYIRDVEVPYE